MKTPFLWSGNKDRYFQKLEIPVFNVYYEPFAGAGAIYFRLLAQRGSFEAHLADVNEDLIITYETIRDNPSYFNNLPLTKDKETFYRLKDSNPTTKEERALRFLYLNRNRFFGLGGWMNADRYARNEVVKRINFFSPLMQQTSFYKSCWDVKFKEDSFIFCDPPYPNTNNKSCYKIDDNILKLNIDYLEYVSNNNFIMITKWHDEINEQFKHLNIKKMNWRFRKPGKAVQEDFEMLIYK